MISDDHEVEPFNVDFTKKYRGDGKLVLTPTSVEMIS